MACLALERPMGAQQAKVGHQFMIERQLLPPIHGVTIETLNSIVALMNVILAMT